MLRGTLRHLTTRTRGYVFWREAVVVDAATEFSTAKGYASRDRPYPIAEIVRRMVRIKRRCEAAVVAGDDHEHTLLRGEYKFFSGKTLDVRGATVADLVAFLNCCAFFGFFDVSAMDRIIDELELLVDELTPLELLAVLTVLPQLPSKAEGLADAEAAAAEALDGSAGMALLRTIAADAPSASTAKNAPATQQQQHEKQGRQGASSPAGLRRGRVGSGALGQATIEVINNRNFTDFRFRKLAVGSSGGAAPAPGYVAPTTAQTSDTKDTSNSSSNPFSVPPADAVATAREAHRGLQRDAGARLHFRGSASLLYRRLCDRALMFLTPSTSSPDTRGNGGEERDDEELNENFSIEEQLQLLRVLPPGAPDSFVRALLDLLVGPLMKESGSTRTSAGGALTRREQLLSVYAAAPIHLVTLVEGLGLLTLDAGAVRRLRAEHQDHHHDDGNTTREDYLADDVRNAATAGRPSSSSSGGGARQPKQQQQQQQQRLSKVEWRRARADAQRSEVEAAALEQARFIVRAAAVLSPLLAAHAASPSQWYVDPAAAIGGQPHRSSMVGHVDLDAEPEAFDEDGDGAHGNSHETTEDELLDFSRRCSETYRPADVRPAAGHARQRHHAGGASVPGFEARDVRLPLALSPDEAARACSALAGIGCLAEGTFAVLQSVVRTQATFVSAAGIAAMFCAGRSDAASFVSLTADHPHGHQQTPTPLSPAPASSESSFAAFVAAMQPQVVALAGRFSLLEMRDVLGAFFTARAAALEDLLAVEEAQNHDQCPTPNSTSPSRRHESRCVGAMAAEDPLLVQERVVALRRVDEATAALAELLDAALSLAQRQQSGALADPQLGTDLLRTIACAVSDHDALLSRTAAMGALPASSLLRVPLPRTFPPLQPLLHALGARVVVDAPRMGRDDILAVLDAAVRLGDRMLDAAVTAALARLQAIVDGGSGIGSGSSAHHREEDDDGATTVGGDEDGDGLQEAFSQRRAARRAMGEARTTTAIATGGGDIASSLTGGVASRASTYRARDAEARASRTQALWQAEARSQALAGALAEHLQSLCHAHEGRRTPLLATAGDDISERGSSSVPATTTSPQPQHIGNSSNRGLRPRHRQIIQTRLLPTLRRQWMAVEQ